MAKVIFKMGESAQLNGCDKVEGQFLVVKDERAIYIDVAEGERIRIGDFQVVADVEGLPESASETALYYIESINVLAKWDADGGLEGAGAWVQINLDTGATDIKVEGAGASAITASYSDETREITLNIPDVLVTTTALDTKIGNLNGKETVVAYVDDKVKEINEAEGGLSTRVEALETKVGEEPVADQISGAIEELDLANTYAAKKHEHTTTEITDFATEMEKKASAEDMTQAKADIEELQGKIAGVTGAMHFKGKVETDPTQMEDLDQYNAGDVVYFGNKEYVLTEEDGVKKFAELGDTTSEGQRIEALETWKTTTDATVKAIPGTYATKGELSEEIEGLGDTYATKEQVSTDIAAAKTELIGSSETVQAKTIVAAVDEANKHADDAIEALGIEDYAKTEDVNTAIETALTWGTF